MKKNKVILSITALMLTASLLATGCKKEVNISSKAIVGLEEGEVTANEYYKSIKEDNISNLVDMIDHKLFDKKYKTTDEENTSVKNQIDNIKKYYPDTNTFNQVISQYFGAKDEKDLESILRLEYKRQKAVEDYVEKNLTDKEIKDYYDNNIYGDMSAKHILITVNAKEDSTDEEKKEAEETAYNKAKEIIKKLEDGEKFDKLAKENSDDKDTATKGGELGSFSYDKMVSEFSDACAKLKVNEYTKEPVKTSYGYHIILKTKQEKKPTLKSVKSKIKEKLREKKLSENTSLYYESLISIREENGITWNDSTLKKAYKKLMDNLIDTTNKTN